MANKHGYHSTRFTKAVGLVQLIALGGIEVSLFISALFVNSFGPQFNVDSPLVLALAAIALLMGWISFGSERKIARVGIILFTLGIGGILGNIYANSLNLPMGEIMGVIALAVFALAVAGYYLLLFGSLKSAGWALAGSAILAIMSAGFWMTLMIINNGASLRDDQMANRMVVGGLLFSSMIVSFIAFLLEMRNKKATV